MIDEGTRGRERLVWNDGKTLDRWMTVVGGTGYGSEPGGGGTEEGGGGGANGRKIM